MKKIWYVEKEDFESTGIGFNPLLEEILYRRGLKGKEELEQYLNPDLGNLYDPFLMKDMKKAVEIIERAVNDEKKVIIYGDYDVDGITSSALLYLFFTEVLECPVQYYLPDRFEEGYGLNMDAVGTFVDEGYDLLITVDCGITAHSEIELAVENGMEVIVTDHHQPGDNLPPADALLNPHRCDDEYPFNKLAGVGVAFKMCQALCEKFNLSDETGYQYLDIVTLGTVADIVPLQEENRIIVSYGLEMIKNSDRPGLKLLVKKLGLDDKEISSGIVGYILAPPLNAAGRMESPEAGIKLLTTSDTEEAETIAESLIEINKERQQEEERIMEEAVEMIEHGVNLDKTVCLVLASDNWHQGVVGIVASRLVDKYYLPVVLIALDDEMGKGSCRSIGALNMFKALKHCSSHLEDFGGHSAAAGLSIKRKKISSFRNCFTNYIEEKLEREDFIPGLYIDSVLEEKDINRSLYDDLERLRPFGVANPEPRFLLNDINIKKLYCVGKENKHLKMLLTGGIDCIGFGMGKICEELRKTDGSISLAVCVSLNTWNGQESVQLKIKDIKFSNIEYDYPIQYKYNGLDIIDNREYVNKAVYLEELYKMGKNILVYSNNMNKRRECLEEISKDVIYYESENDVNLEKEDEKWLCFFSDSYLPADVFSEELVLFSLPYSLGSLCEMIKNYYPVRVHLLFDHSDYYFNQNKLKMRIPTREFLRKFYLFLKQNNKKSQSFSLTKVIERTDHNTKLIRRSCEIFEELNLIKCSDDKISLLSFPQNRLDLSESLRYNKHIANIEKFNTLSKILYTDNVFKSLDLLQKRGNCKSIIE